MGTDAKFISKRLNLLLSNGLYLVSAKVHKKRPFAVISLTTFADDVRVVFDLESKKILGNTRGVEIPAQDVEKVMTILRKNVEKIG